MPYMCKLLSRETDVYTPLQYCRSLWWVCHVDEKEQLIPNAPYDKVIFKIIDAVINVSFMFLESFEYVILHTAYNTKCFDIIIALIDSLLAHLLSLLLALHSKWTCHENIVTEKGSVLTDGVLHCWYTQQACSQSNRERL